MIKLPLTFRLRLLCEARFCYCSFTEGGLEAVEPVLMKAAGIEAARQIMSQAVDSYTDFVQSRQPGRKLASEYEIKSEEDAAF